MNIEFSPMEIISLRDRNGYAVQMTGQAYRDVAYGFAWRLSSGEPILTRATAVEHRDELEDELQHQITEYFEHEHYWRGILDEAADHALSCLMYGVVLALVVYGLLSVIGFAL